MKLLAIDTSTEACSAALWLEGEVHQHYQIAPREHGQLILPMIESLLADAGLTLAQMDTLAFGRGPGGFTGVRIANGVIQGLAFGADLPVVPVSSLAALAQGAHTDMNATHILAAIDARMGEVYWGVYHSPENGLVVQIEQEIVCLPQQVPLPNAGLNHHWVGAGSGWLTYAQPLQARLGNKVSSWDGHRYPQARHIAQLGADAFQRGLAVSAEHALPVYLRDEVAWKKSS